jgi:WD40 repeat protein
MPVFAQNRTVPSPYDSYLLHTGHTGRILSVHKQGDFLVSASADKSIRLWNMKTGELTDAFFMDQEIDNVILTQDLQFVVATDSSGTLVKMDVASGKIISELSNIIETRFHSQSYLLGDDIILINKSEVQSINAVTLEKNYYVNLQSYLSSSRINLSRHGDFLTGSNGESSIQIDMKSGDVVKEDLIQTLQVYASDIWLLDTGALVGASTYYFNYYSENNATQPQKIEIEGKLFYEGGDYLTLVKKDKVSFFDMNMNIVREIESSQISGYNGTFFLDSHTLAVCDDKGSISVYENFLDINSPVLILGEEKAWNTDLSLVAEKKGTYITAHQGNGTVRTWQTSSGSPKKTFTADSYIKGLGLNNREDTLIVGTNDSLTALSLSTLNVLNTLDCPAGVGAITVCENPDVVVSFYPDKKALSLWYWKEKDREEELIPLESNQKNLKLFSLGGDRILLTDLGDFYQCFSIEEKRVLWEEMDEITPSRYKPQFVGSHDGKLVMAYRDGKVYQESETPGKMELLIDLNPNISFVSMDLSFESNILIGGSLQGEIYYYDMSNGELLETLTVCTGEVSTVKISDSPYGRNAIITDESGGISSWTRVGNKWKFIVYPINGAALLLRLSSHDIFPRAFGDLPGGTDILELRKRSVPRIISSRWDQSALDSEDLSILIETGDIPNGEVLEVSIYQSSSYGGCLGAPLATLKDKISDGQVEFHWQAEDCRASNEISPLYFQYRLSSRYIENVTGDTIQVQYPEIVETFWYSERCSEQEPAILTLTVKDISPMEPVELIFYDNQNRTGQTTVIGGFKIGKMEDPILITRQKLRRAGLNPDREYYISLKTGGNILYEVEDPLFYQ